MDKCHVVPTTQFNDIEIKIFRNLLILFLEVLVKGYEVYNLTPLPRGTPCKLPPAFGSNPHQTKT